jgi:hypothetical protein
MDRLLGEWISLTWALKELWRLVREDVPMTFYDWRRGRPFVKCRTCQKEWISQHERAYYVGECQFCWNRERRVKEHG